MTIKGASPYVQLINAAGARLGYIQHNATDLIYNADTGIHKFNQNATFSGNVTAGTLSVGSSGTSRFTDTSAYPLQLNRGLDVDVYGTNGAFLSMGSIKAGSYVDAIRMSGGLAVNGTDGNYILQTLGGGSYTTALSIDSSQNATFAGNTNISGNLGVGMTTAPTAKLEVSANVAKGILINRTFTTSSQTLADVRAYYGLAITPLRGGTGGLYFTNYDADTPIIQSVNTSNVAQFLLLNPLGGNVGIGTDSPGAKLHVESASSSAYFKLKRGYSGSESALVFGSESLTNFIDSQGASASTAKPFVFKTGETERMRILASGGITFNGDTSTSNALDDYEEGTFTGNPTTGDTSNISSLVYSEGIYTKIGRLVNISLRVRGSIGSASAEAYFTVLLPVAAPSLAVASAQYSAGTYTLVAGSGANRFGIGSVFMGTNSNRTTKTMVFIAANQINTSGSIDGRLSYTYTSS